MMCFRDRTFCTAPCDCRACSILLTDLIREQAQQWGERSGHPPLIAQANRSGGCPDFVLDLCACLPTPFPPFGRCYRDRKRCPAVPFITGRASSTIRHSLSALGADCQSQSAPRFGASA